MCKMRMNKLPKMKLIIDTDCGVDDALALLYAFNQPDVQVVAVTCVVGNGSIDNVVDATLKTMDCALADDQVVVAKGFAEPLIEKAHYAPFIHGEDCLGDLKPAYPKSKRALAQDHAVQVILQQLRKAEEKVTIVALAPLTNVAVAYRMDKQLFHEKVEKIVWMGGAVSVGGNFRSWSEANAAYDPEAAHIILTSGLTLLMYPWDIFINLDFTKNELVGLGFPFDVLDDPGKHNFHASAELATRIMYREMRNWKKDTAVLGDCGAMIIAIHPELATTEFMNVQMEMQGHHTRGMTVCDLRTFVDPPDIPKKEPNVHVVTKVNVEGVKANFVQHVLQSSKN